MRVLVVDAALPSLSYHSTVLKGMSQPDTPVEVLRATSGREALALWATQTECGAPLDFILMDAQLPDIDGYAVTRQIRATEKPGEWTPILLMSALLSDAHLSRGIAAGADDYLTKPASTLLLTAKLQAMKRINGIRTKLIRMKDALEAAATIDSLTGIANRRRFDEVLRLEWLRAIREKTQLSLIMLDVDYFKKYNDLYGHHQGDICLAAVASTLAGIVQRPADLVARYGGEEFVMLLPSTPLAGAEHVANRLRSVIVERQLPHGDSPIGPYVTISVGVAATEPNLDGYCSGPGVPTPALALLQRADQALYHSKRKGRNCVSRMGRADQEPV